jgi:hypothetical protein
MGDSPRLFDVNVKVNYLGLKLKHVRNGYPLRENLSIVSCLGGKDNAAKPHAQPCAKPYAKPWFAPNPSVAGGRYSSYNSHGKTI